MKIKMKNVTVLSEKKIALYKHQNNNASTGGWGRGDKLTFVTLFIYRVLEVQGIAVESLKLLEVVFFTAYGRGFDIYSGRCRAGKRFSFNHENTCHRPKRNYRTLVWENRALPLKILSSTFTGKRGELLVFHRAVRGVF
jgi:hypothetical protein